MRRATGQRCAGVRHDAWPARLGRLKPAFLLIGAQKGGTTSLYFNLCEHPRVLPMRRQEAHYFDRLYSRGVRWCARLFPRQSRSGEAITGDVTPAYLYYPPAAARAHALLPDAKIIVILRDPAERAWSHYRHNVRKGIESRPFEEAIEADLARITPRVQQAPPAEAWREEWDDEMVRFSYVSRGRYAEQLARWLALYPRERFLFLRSRDFDEAPAQVLARTARFLELPEHQWDNPKRHNVGSGGQVMPAPARDRLREHFQPWNARLAELLGEVFDFNATQASQAV